MVRGKTFWLWLPLLMWNGSVLAQTHPGACSFLTKSEIQAVQGESIVRMKESSPKREGIAVSHCFYDAKTFDKSVSLEMTWRNPLAPAHNAPRERWKRLFHSAGGSPRPQREKKGKDNGGKTGDEGEEGQPFAVDGIGNEAFWMGDPVVGSLFVLKGDVYFRISVGGWADGAVRLEKTKALAQKVAKRI